MIFFRLQQQLQRVIVRDVGGDGHLLLLLPSQSVTPQSLWNGCVATLPHAPIPKDFEHHMPLREPLFSDTLEWVRRYAPACTHS